MTLLTTVGLPKQAFDGRQRRLGAHHAALAFERVEQRGFLAADIGARADTHFQVEQLLRAHDVPAEHAFPGARSRRRHSWSGWR